MSSRLIHLKDYKPQEMSLNTPQSIRNNHINVIPSGVVIQCDENITRSDSSASDTDSGSFYAAQDDRQTKCDTTVRHIANTLH